MSAEISLVQEIQKHPCLYNNYLPEYNRRDLTDEAWAEVAQNNNLTVGECKEKWRNIRCSFLRSMKPKAKFKKPYYLTEYLQFILPFMKSLNNSETFDETQFNEANKHNSSKDIVISTIKSEPEEEIEGQSDEDNASIEIPVTITETITPDSLISRQQPSAFRKRRRPMPGFTKTFTEKKLKRSKHNQGHTLNLGTLDSNRGNNSAMRYFLLSLLPEFETMTDEQIRLFKIKVMLLIDELKTNDTQIRRSINANDSERLQKRLINLLTKNLKKTS